jgi:hypothetical protein
MTMNRDALEGFMFGLGAGFVIAYILKPPQNANILSSVPADDAGAAPDTMPGSAQALAAEAPGAA